MSHYAPGKVTEPAGGGQEPRDSIWSVKRKYADTFFATLFTLWIGAAAGMTTTYLNDHGKPEGQTAAEYILRVALDNLLEMGAATIAIVVIAMMMTPPLTLAGGAIVITYESLKARWVTPVIQKHEARGEARGIAQGEERANERWNAWLERRQQAEANNQPFDEPPPTQPTQS